MASEKEKTPETPVAEKMPPKSEAEKPVAGSAKTPLAHRLREFLKTKKGKVVAAMVLLAVLVASITAVPFTRYAVAGMFIKKDVSVTLQDAKTGKPVSDATVSVGSQSAKTDKDGKATVRQVPVGQYTLAAYKTFYKQSNVTVTVPILSNADAGTVKIEATGRQVPVVINNKVGGKHLAKVMITAGQATAITDDNGEATLIAPADQTTVQAELKADGFNTQTATITITEQKDDRNTFAMVPSGTIYFLSKRTGKINVMKSDLDGGNAKVVVQATGKEDEYDTQLIASRDWKYLAFKSKRDDKPAKLYLITTADDKMSVIDEGTAEFTVSGWADSRLVYHVVRTNVGEDQAGKRSIKSYDATSGKLTELYKSQPYYGPSITLIGNEVIYTNWYNIQTYPAGTKIGVYSVQADGTGAKTVVETTRDKATGYDVRQYEPREVRILGNMYGGNKEYEYKDGKLSEVKLDEQAFYNASYPVFLQSPSAKQVFWAEARDGKAVMLTGDQNGENEKEIAKLDTGYRQYGWFTDNYVLVSKNNSELYILPASGADTPLKVTDYHKPAYGLSYGGGYGGY